MYKTAVIPTLRYCNPKELIGYVEFPKVYENKPLHPALADNKYLHHTIITNLKRLYKDYPFIRTGYTHFLLPEDRLHIVRQHEYKQTKKPEPLKSVFTTWYLIPKKHLKCSTAKYLIDQTRISPLADTVSKQNSPTIYSNLGYFIPPGLLYSDSSKATDWAFNKRYPEFHIKLGALPAVGFYYIKQQEKIYSTVSDFPRGSIGIKTNGEVTILSDIPVDSYMITLRNYSFIVHDREINNLNNISKKTTLITPSVRTKLTSKYQAEIASSLWETNSWRNYKEIIRAPGTINFFVTNRGNGTYPEDTVATVWKDSFPVIPFGYIISIPDSQITGVFKSKNADNFLEQPVTVSPKSNKINFEEFQTIYSAAIPLINDGHNTLASLSAYQIMQQLNKLGSFTHPNILLSQESKCYSPVIREAMNIAIETENYFGNLLFSGRFELSIGASLIDLPVLLKMLEKALPEPLKNALMLDGGSGVKAVYAPDKKTLLPLNIISAGYRNHLGDPNGNYYFSLVHPL